MAEPDPDRPISDADALNLAIRREREKAPDGREDFAACLKDFASALDHLVIMAGFYVGDGDRQYLEPDTSLFRVAARAFIEADKGRWEARPPWESTLLGRPWPGYETIHAGLVMFDRAMGAAGERWGCVRQWFLRDGTPWLGRLYPEDFPWSHTIARRELDMLGAALRLVRMTPSPAPAVRDEPFNPERLRDGRVLPVVLGKTCEEASYVLAGGTWNPVKLSKARHSLLKAIVRSYRENGLGLKLADLKCVAGGSRTTFRNMQKDEVLSRILTPPRPRGHGDGRGYGFVFGGEALK